MFNGGFYGVDVAAAEDVFQQSFIPNDVWLIFLFVDTIDLVSFEKNSLVCMLLRCLEL